MLLLHSLPPIKFIASADFVFRLLNAVEVDEEHAEDLRTIAVQSKLVEAWPTWDLSTSEWEDTRSGTAVRMRSNSICCKDAVKACDHVLELDPHNEKALFRWLRAF
eukprot:473058-Hanusia_phi.AAC.2